MIVLSLGRLEARLDGARALLAGRLDDSAPLGELLARLPPGDVAIDTAAIVFVNSVGMREWLRLVRGLRARGRVVLERVSEVLLAQMNLVAELATAVTIVSFHAPYACPRCGGEHAPLVDAVASAALLRRLIAPAMPCPECGAAMALADFPERHLGI